MAFTRVILLQLKIPGVSSILRYQSYQLADYSWSGKTWTYAPFEVKSQPEQSLELIAENAQIWIQNNSIIRSYIRDYDGLRKTIATIYFVDPAGTSPTGVLRLQIASSNSMGGYYVFNLSTPLTALAGAAVNKYFNRQHFPELPLVPTRL